MRPRAFLLYYVVTLAAALVPEPARADETNDGVYGRFDGDLDLRLAAGASFARGGPSFSAGLAAVYLNTAGIYAHYTDALGADAPDVARSIAVGVHLQPLFLGRYAKDREHGPAHLDLILDSLGVELGSFWAAPRGRSLHSIPGLELGLTLGVPLFPRATGLFLDLRGVLRFGYDESSNHGGIELDRSALFSIALGYHQIINTHIVDAGDIRPR